MKVVKAITLREPTASRIAAGEETIAYTGFRTPYRGEILIVADQEPWYGLALAELVDVRGISPEMNAPLTLSACCMPVVITNPADSASRIKPLYFVLNVGLRAPLYS